MYDTIVIGNDLSSLIAATILSHRGLKTVLVCEGDAQYTYEESGYTFNIDPSPLTGFGPAQICSRLAADLGISITQCTGLHLLNPGLQIIMPDHRLDFFYNQEDLFREMEREFVGHAGNIRKLYMSILKISEFIGQQTIENPRIFPKSYKEMAMLLRNVPALMLEWLSLSKAFKRVKTNSSLKRVIEAESTLLSNFHIDSNIGTTPVPSAYTLSLPLRGIYYSMGGNEFLLRSVKSRFDDSGGQIIKNCSVIRINAGRKTDVDVQLTEDTLSKIEGRYLIVSTKWEKLKLLLLNDRKYRRLERTLKSVKSMYYPFTLHMGVTENCIPEKMAAYVAVFINHKSTIVNNNFVFIETSAAGDTKRAPHGKRALTATIYLKESPLVLNDEELRGISKTVLQSLGTFLPFLQENLDFINIDKSIEFSRKNQEVTNQKYCMRYCPFLGMSRISNKTHIHNVYMTGGMLMAGLGFEGEIISGINAADSILSREGKTHGYRTN
ncbi:MAG TPA: FAD-dependent oxidoreductase [Syntrophales bacterium]|nr:FAD-dependent oxidoreductase [Syntrophales bacterium]